MEGRDSYCLSRNHTIDSPYQYRTNANTNANATYMGGATSIVEMLMQDDTRLLGTMVHEMRDNYEHKLPMWRLVRRRCEAKW